MLACLRFLYDFRVVGDGCRWVCVMDDDALMDDFGREGFIFDGNVAVHFEAVQKYPHPGQLSDITLLKIKTILIILTADSFSYSQSSS